MLSILSRVRRRSEEMAGVCGFDLAAPALRSGEAGARSRLSRSRDVSPLRPAGVLPA